VILSLAFTAKINPTTSRMWQAYAIAPAVAPLSFVAWHLLLELLARRNALSDTRGTVMVWIIALFNWTAASYIAAAIIAMPVAFLLRRFGNLNGLSILVASLIGAFAFSVYVSIRMMEPTTAKIASGIVSALFSLAIPFSASAIVFWMIAGYDDFAKWNKS
jgi:hypothetical protein